VKTLSLIAAAVLFAFPRTSINASSFDVETSWVGDVLRIEVKTDAPDGAKFLVNIVDRKTMDRVLNDMRYPNSPENEWVTVESGRFIIDGFVRDGKPFPAGRYGLAMTEFNTLNFAGVPITIPARAKNQKKASASKATAAHADVAVTKEDYHNAKNAMVVKLQLTGQLRLDCPHGKVWIDPVLWEAMDAELKENFSRTLYEGCSSVVGDGSIDIYDAQSAKKLARYDSTLGFRAY
jgi:hypothetical protein